MLRDTIIIGAGMAGLELADELAKDGQDVVVFEKARGTGGRMSSKRFKTDHGQWLGFDLGCSGFEANTIAFQHQLEQWQQAGVIVPWVQTEQQGWKYVATPRNSALTRHLSNGIECHFASRISRIEKHDHWSVYDEAGSCLASARTLVLTVPPQQAIDLLPAGSFEDYFNKVVVKPQWVLMLATKALPDNLDPYYHNPSPAIASISRESSKPGRELNSEGLECLVIQASAEWSAQHLDDKAQQIYYQLKKELESVLGQALPSCEYYAHRWLYSQVDVDNDAMHSQDYWWHNSGLALASDYTCSRASGVEAAWLAAKSLAQWLSDADVSAAAVGSN